MDNWIYDQVPTAIVTVLGLCVLWVLFRIVRALFRQAPARHEPSLHVTPVTVAQQEPRIAPGTVSHSAIPDAADVLALKQSIDNLARQIAVLERRLAGSDIPRTIALRSQGGVEAVPPDTPTAPPVIVPERRT